MIKVIVNGCLGAMGKVLTSCINEDDSFFLAAGVSKLGELSNEYPMYKNILEVKEDADVIIDFSKPESLSDLLSYAKQKKIPLVIATTGYSESELQKISEASNSIPIFHSSNMSVGVNLLLKLVEIASKSLEDFDIEIVEKHHNKKVDAPSGTAIMIANEIKSALSGDCEYNYGRHGKDAKRQPKEVGIHAVRGGTIVGDHSVMFAGTDEIIEINHIALSKKIFAQGSLKAAKLIVNKENGYYNMKNIVSL